jgi:hypothetical protein
MARTNRLVCPRPPPNECFTPFFTFWQVFPLSVHALDRAWNKQCNHIELSPIWAVPVWAVPEWICDPASGFVRAA